MDRKTSLIGRRFGRLTVIEISDKKDKHGSTFYRCRCECGKETVTRAAFLENGRTRSCGCLAKENAVKHHGSHSRLYHIWYGVIRRTEDSSRKEYNACGARGIQMCREWRGDFEAFRDWALENGYSDTLQLRRKDKAGSYCPENCIWEAPPSVRHDEDLTQKEGA
jgi:hypothetical protein